MSLESEQKPIETAEQQGGKKDIRRTCFGIWAVVGGIVIFLALVNLLQIIATPVSVLVWTAVFVFIMRGTVNALEKKGLNRAAGTAIAYLILFVVILVIAFFMFSPLFGFSEQFIDLLESLPSYVSALGEWCTDIYARYAHLFSGLPVDEWINAAAQSMSEWVSSFASDAAGGIVSIGSAIVNSAVAIGFALVLAFWLLMELPAMGREARRIIPPSRYDDAEMFHLTFTRVMGGFIRGTLIQCFVIGAGCGILFGLCGIPNAAALAVITGVFNIIPIVGPWVGGIIAGIVGLMESPLMAVIAVAGTIAIQQVVYTFIGPKIMESNVDVHPALTLFALLLGSAVGVAMGGLMGSLVGMLLALPAVAVCKAMFVYFYEKNTKRVIVAEDGVFFKGKSSKSETGEINPVGDATSVSASETTQFASTSQQ